MHLQPRVALLFTLAASLQVSLTIASTQECAQQSGGLPSLSVSSIATSLAAQCPSVVTDPTSDCVVDLSDSSFADSCKSAGGEVYELDYTITCPSSDSDATQTLVLNNYYNCAAKICTLDDVKTIVASSKDVAVANSFGADCSVKSYDVTSGSMLIHVSASLFGTLAAGLLFLVDIL